MSITESSSRTSIPQEVENPSSFNFSIPPPEESPSIPVCGAGEMVESISPPADILVSPVLHSRNTLVCSPTLVLSSEKSPILEEQSVAKSNEGPFSEETNIAVKVLYNCKSCLRQKVGEAAEYFTNQKQGGCLYVWFRFTCERYVSNLCESL
uniref:Uncharacterized protein n=1 Tax=Solanum tuberosum TaxID=4113 RepID=M1DFS3_SOLTU